MIDDEEIFDSSIRTDGRLAGVYEQDADSGYFYLYDLERPEGQKVVDAIRIHSGGSSLVSEDVSIDWDQAETIVGLFIKGRLWAMFTESGEKWRGGIFGEESPSEIPSWLQQAFAIKSH